VVEGTGRDRLSRLTIHGVQDHAGPTPMRIRHDALVAPPRLIGGVADAARSAAIS